uniref:Uncharacterized protein n=1 Tax=Anguilla anguilla TaxID=7936 RepID=A0A0E9RGA1_ANGAN
MLHIFYLGHLTVNYILRRPLHSPTPHFVLLSEKRKKNWNK